MPVYEVSLCLLCTAPTHDLNLAKHGNPNSQTGKVEIQFGLGLNQDLSKAGRWWKGIRGGARPTTAWVQIGAKASLLQMHCGPN